MTLWSLLVLCFDGPLCISLPQRHTLPAHNLRGRFCIYSNWTHFRRVFDARIRRRSSRCGTYRQSFTFCRFSKNKCASGQYRLPEARTKQIGYNYDPWQRFEFHTSSLVGLSPHSLAKTLPTGNLRGRHLTYGVKCQLLLLHISSLACRYSHLNLRRAEQLYGVVCSTRC